MSKSGTDPSPIVFGMGVLQRGGVGRRLPCVPASRQHGGANRIFKPEVGGSVHSIRWVFDRDRMSGRILLVQESGKAQHPVPVRASGIAAEGLGDPLEHLFLMLKVEARDAPESLIFARRCRDNRGWRGHLIRRLQPSKSDVTLLVDVEVEMTDRGTHSLVRLRLPVWRGLAETYTFAPSSFS